MKLLKSSYGFYHSKFFNKNCIHPPSHFRIIAKIDENATAGKPFCFTCAEAKMTSRCVNYKLKSFKDILKIKENLA